MPREMPVGEGAVVKPVAPLSGGLEVLSCNPWHLRWGLVVLSCNPWHRCRGQKALIRGFRAISGAVGFML